MASSNQMAPRDPSVGFFMRLPDARHSPGARANTNGLNRRRRVGVCVCVCVWRALRRQRCVGFHFWRPRPCHCHQSGLPTVPPRQQRRRGSPGFRLCSWKAGSHGEPVVPWVSRPTALLRFHFAAASRFGQHPTHFSELGTFF